MSPSPNNAPGWIHAPEILAQVGEELAIVEAGKDTGLLPVHGRVMDLEKLPRDSAPAELAAGLAAIRRLLDQILDGTGKFSEEASRFLNEWHPWMGSVLMAGQRGGEAPALPPAWGGSSPGVVVVVQPAASVPAPTSPAAADEPVIRLNLAEDSELLTEFHSGSLELLQTIARGKAALGTVRLSAAQRRGGIIIKIQDDGKRLNRDRIQAKVRKRGKLTPLLRLGQHLGAPGRAVDPTEGIIVVVESGAAARGLLVDELLGKQEAVIKNLGEKFRKQNLLAGAAILGDGRGGLILDMDTLVRCQANSN